MDSQSDPSLLRTAITEAYDLMKDASDELLECLRNEPHGPWIAWSEDLTEEEDAPRALFRYVEALEFRDKKADGREAPHAPLVGGVSNRVLELAAIVNARRKNLADAVKAANGLMVANDEGEQIPLMRHALTLSKVPRLNLVLATRHFVLLDRLPERISYTWATGRKVERMSVTEVRTRLERYGEGASLKVAADLSVLSGHPPDEPLALVRPPHVHLRANLTFSNDQGETIRRQVRATSPILYPWSIGANAPAIRPPEPYRDGEPRRGRRRESIEIEKHPFLKTLPVHRYKGRSALPRGRGRRGQSGRHGLVD